MGENLGQDHFDLRWVHPGLEASDLGHHAHLRAGPAERRPADSGDEVGVALTVAAGADAGGVSSHHRLARVTEGEASDASGRRRDPAARAFDAAVLLDKVRVAVSAQRSSFVVDPGHLGDGSTLGTTTPVAIRETRGAE